MKKYIIVLACMLISACSSINMRKSSSDISFSIRGDGIVAEGDTLYDSKENSFMILKEIKVIPFVKTEFICTSNSKYFNVKNTGKYGFNIDYIGDFCKSIYGDEIKNYAFVEYNKETGWKIKSDTKVSKAKN